MKKFLIGVLMMLGAQICSASMDRDGSMRPAVWRATETCVSLNFVLLSTRSVNIYHVRVTSAVVNTVNGSAANFYSLYNSTARPQSDNAGNFLSTGTKVMMNYQVFGSSMGAGFAYSLAWPPQVIPVYYSSGVVINKPNVGCVELLWEFSTPTFDPFYPWRP